MRNRFVRLGALTAIVATAVIAMHQRGDAGVTTTTPTMNCLAYPQNSLAGGPQAAPTAATFTVNAPDEVLQAETFALTVQMAPIDIPLTNSGYTVNNIKTLRAEIPDPANATINSVSIAGGSPGWTMTLESDPWDRFKRTLLEDGSRRSLYDVVEFPEGHPNRPGR